MAHDGTKSIVYICNPDLDIERFCCKVQESFFVPASFHIMSESRRRQSKRDDAIRRRIEHDLNKKKKGNVRTTRGRRGAPGSVLSLNPLEPIICEPQKTVYEVAQLMTARRENCVLVVSGTGELLGIFTAKDLAFRIVGSGLSANTITVDEIMTPNPMCANANTPAAEALTLMVQKGFRHLPVLDDGNQIVGVLDITKCYAQQMQKLDRMYTSSKKLYEALDNVNSEMGLSQHPAHIFQYFENLKSKMNAPTVKSVLTPSNVPIYTSVRSSVYDATVLMKENKTTAVLIKDSKEEVAGIFTSKDVVLRVIAAGLEPKNCSVVRVMTPQPDVASEETSIQQALKQMLDGHYLNLPIVNTDNEIIGIVDVLRLTYSILSHIKRVESGEEEREGKKNLYDSDTIVDSEGPAWQKFWTSLDNETDSAHSGSLVNSAPEVTQSEFQSFSLDIKPSDSISHCESPVKSSNTLLKPNDTTYTFKFKSPAFEGRVHRITMNYSEGILRMRELIDSKLLPADFEALSLNSDGSEQYAMSYLDDEGDIVSITTDADLIDCVKVYSQLNNNKADIFLHNPNADPSLNFDKIRKSRKNESLCSLIPNDYIIPLALSALAASVVIGFSLSRK